MSRAEDRDSEAQAAARAGACHDPLAAAQAASGCGTEWQPQPERPRDVPLVSLEAQSAGPSPQWKPEAWPYETTSDERTHKRRQILPMIRASGTIMMRTLRLCKPTALPERTSIRSKVQPHALSTATAACGSRSPRFHPMDLPKPRAIVRYRRSSQATATAAGRRQQVPSSAGESAAHRTASATATKCRRLARPLRHADRSP